MPIACSTAMASNGEEATTSFIKPDGHVRDREGRELSYQVGTLIALEAAQGHLKRKGIAESSGGELKMERPKGP